MRKMKLKLLGVIAVFAFGLTVMGFATSASANAVYSATSFLSLTLTNITSESGDFIHGGDWSVSYENYFIDADIFTNGDGTAAYDYTPGSGYLGVDDTVTVATSVTGGTGLGIAESYVLTELALYADNYSEYNLTFEFDYSYYLFAEVDSSTNLPGEMAQAAADVDMIDDFDLDVLDNVAADLDPFFGSLEDDGSDYGSFSFTLLPYEGNYISAFISSDGRAVGTAPVPEPATMMMLGVGLAGLGVTRLRKKSKKTRPLQGGI